MFRIHPDFEDVRYKIFSSAGQSHLNQPAPATTLCGLIWFEIEWEIFYTSVLKKATSSTQQKRVLAINSTRLKVIHTEITLYPFDT
jgi:hypothetical protein